MRKRTILIAVIFLLVMSVPVFTGAECSKKTAEDDGGQTNHATESSSECPDGFDFPNQEELGMPVYEKNVIPTSITGTKSSLTGEPDEYELHYETTDSFNDVVWFFDQEANWEVQVKVLDSTSIDTRFWFFQAATTDMEYVMTVTDKGATTSEGGTSIDVAKSDGSGVSP